MIPIECPKCGREGNVPPDRLNAKLTCRGCQAVFHLDNSGRMVMGPPGEPGAKGRPHVSYAKPGADFNLAESLAGIPKPVKFGVPVAALALLAWFTLMPGAGGPDYLGNAETIVRGMITNNRSKVVSYATSTTVDAAGKWSDLLHSQVEKRGIPADVPISPALLTGNPDSGGSITVMVVLIGTGASATQSPLAINLHMVRAGGSWQIDGERCFSDAEKALASESKK